VSYQVGLLSNVAWMSKAACVDESHRLFISDNADDMAKAKAICRDCQVKLPCMEQYFDVTCVAGGLSYYERLIGIWREVESVNESNWRKPHYLLQQYR
jgi:hypothetical protein